MSSTAQAVRINRLNTLPFDPQARLRAGAVIASVASAFPETSYSQEEVGALLGLENRVVKKLLRAPHIQKRHLYLPEEDARTGRARPESAADLHAKFRDGALEIGSRAIRDALDAASLVPGGRRLPACVSRRAASWFRDSARSSRVSSDSIRGLVRADVVGMGCNAGLNGLNPLAQWVKNHPGKVALLVCCEINSAMYVVDDTVRTGIVNSLFGDGAAAAVLTSIPGAPGILADPAGAIGHRFRKLLHPRAVGGDAVRLERRCRQVELLISTVTSPMSSASTSASHWSGCWSETGWISPTSSTGSLHTGGGAVIESVKLSLGLDEHDVRHTRSVLRDYGNISSGSFLVSLERLLAEGCASAGDRGVMVTMGPGAQIEAALLQFGRAGPC